MKPPVRVWVVVNVVGRPVSVRETADDAELCRWDKDTIARYRLDTPKPRRAKHEEAVILAAKRWKRTGEGFQLSEALYQLERSANLKPKRPKPAAKKRIPPSRLNVAGGVVRKKRKAKP